MTTIFWLSFQFHKMQSLRSFPLHFSALFSPFFSHLHANGLIRIITVNLTFFFCTMYLCIRIWFCYIKLCTVLLCSFNSLVLFAKVLGINPFVLYSRLNWLDFENIIQCRGYKFTHLILISY